MRNANGMGSVYKLKGNRRKPYIVRKTVGWDIDKETGKVKCLIDLDTVMPGSILYDVGDAIRYGANTASEEETDVPRKDVLRYEKCEAGRI